MLQEPNPYTIMLYKILFLLLLSLGTKAQTVYKTPSGKKYHLAGCRMVENVSQAITPDQARDLGLEPCKICKPADIYVVPATGKPQGQAPATVQCKGITKAGTRCKHMTRIANGYCAQHSP